MEDMIMYGIECLVFGFIVSTAIELISFYRKKKVVKKEFKVGDRVAAYHGTFGRITGTIISNVDFFYKINNSKVEFHEKQLRRLKRKNK